MTEVAVIGIDIGKTSFHLIALNATGAIQWKKKFSRAQLMRHMDDRHGGMLRCPPPGARADGRGVLGALLEAVPTTCTPLPRRRPFQAKVKHVRPLRWRMRRAKAT